MLQDEGFEVSMRELSRVRTKNRWLLREPTEARKRKIMPGRRQSTVDGTESDEEDADSDEDDEDDGAGDGAGAGIVGAVEDELDPVQLERREQRRRELAIESAEKWAAKKRRRRTRDWAGLPADPPGPPRFPSETTLEESKAILELDAERYRYFRERFQKICEDAGVIKKTLAGPEKWEAAKEQLVREMAHLRSLLWDKEGLESKRLAIDVICCDVTKRMRTAGKQMTLAAAKNMLGMNPEEARETRFAFYRILAADKFAGKLESGEERWNELKQKWLDESALLQRILASQDEEPSRADRIRAIDMLARDVRKRYKDDITKGREKKLPPATDTGTGQSVGTPSSDQSPGARRRGRVQEVSSHTQARLLPAGVMPGQPDLSSIDPNLGSSMLMAPDGQAGYAVGQQFVQQYPPAQESQVYHPAGPPAGATTRFATYFRLHPTSTVVAVPPMWISMLGSRSVEELRSAAVAKFPGAVCLAVEGLVKDGKGGEVPLQIRGDAELEAYLDHVQSMQGGAPSFSVHLVRGWNTS